MSFFLGFATGAAKAVDTALQDSIKRTRDNIDMMSEFRLKRAAQAEEKRKKDGEELEDLLKYGAGVIDSVNNPEAVRMAASLYEEKGEAGFKSFITDIEQKKNDTGVSPYAFFSDADKTEKAKDLYAPSDYVNYFLDSAEQYGQPDQAVFQGIQRGGGLLEAITGPIDVAKESARRTPIKTTVRDVKPVTFGSYTFNREDYSVYNMTPSERVTYFTNKVNKPGISDEERKKAEEKLNESLTTARENGGLETQKEAIEIALRRTPVGTDEHNSLTDELANVNYSLKVNAAAGNPLELKKLELLKATEELAENPDSIEAQTKVRDLSREVKNLEVGTPTASVLAKRKQEDIEFKTLNQDNYVGSEEEKQDKAELQELKFMGDVSPNEIKSAFDQLYAMGRKTLVTTGKFKDALMLNDAGDVEYIGSEEARQFLISQYQKVYDQLVIGTDADPRAYDKAFQLLTSQLPAVSEAPITGGGAVGNAASQTSSMLGLDLGFEDVPDDSFILQGKSLVEEQPDRYTPDASGVAEVIDLVEGENLSSTEVSLFSSGIGGDDFSNKVLEAIRVIPVLDKNIKPQTQSQKTKFEEIKTYDKVKMAEAIKNTQKKLADQGLSPQQPGQNRAYFSLLSDTIKQELIDVYNMNDAQATETTKNIVSDLEADTEQSIRQELEQLSDSQLRNPASFKFDPRKKEMAIQILKERQGQAGIDNTNKLLEQRRSEVAQEQAELQALIDAGDYESMTQKQLDRIVGDPTQPESVIKKANQVRVTLTPQKITDASNEELLDMIDSNTYMNRQLPRSVLNQVIAELESRKSGV